jgi:hypothetical protein
VTFSLKSCCCGHRHRVADLEADTVSLRGKLGTLVKDFPRISSVTKWLLTNYFRVHRPLRRKCLQKSMCSLFISTRPVLTQSRAEKGNSPIEATDVPKSPTEPAPAVETKKRPRLDVSEISGGRDRKRGKSMFGILVGTLNKAKIEDKERSASEAVRQYSFYLS